MVPREGRARSTDPPPSRAASRSRTPSWSNAKPATSCDLRDPRRTVALGMPVAGVGPVLRTAGAIRSNAASLAARSFAHPRNRRDSRHVSLGVGQRQTRPQMVAGSFAARERYGTRGIARAPRCERLRTIFLERRPMAALGCVISRCVRVDRHRVRDSTLVHFQATRHA
jgi:hypothetical protein